jgi:hypothetical protein
MFRSGFFEPRKWWLGFRHRNLRRWWSSPPEKTTGISERRESVLGFRERKKGKKMKKTLGKGLYKHLDCVSTVRSRVRGNWINPTPLMRLDSPDPCWILGMGFSLTGLRILVFLLLYQYCFLLFAPPMCSKALIKVLEKFLWVFNVFLDIFVNVLHIKIDKKYI